MANDLAFNNPGTPPFQLSPMAVAVGVIPPPTVQDWQLLVGHYEIAVEVDPEITHPRPDSETLAWERHRLAPAGIPWSIPVAVHGGSWPHYHDVDAASEAKGIAIGKYLAASGDVLVVPDDYAVLSWANPTLGTHTVTVDVKTQEYARNLSGFADHLTRDFTLTVADKNDTTKFAWLDPVSGNDATGDGSYDNPFATLGHVTDSDSYGGRQIHIKQGTVTTDAAAQIALAVANKPGIIVGHSGAQLSMTQRNFTLGSGAGLFDVTVPNGGFGAATTNARYLSLGASAQRITFFRVSAPDPLNGTTGDDNPTLVFSSAGGVPRNYITFHRCSESGRQWTGNSSALHDLYRADYVVTEFNDVVGNSRYPVWLKDSNRHCTIRANRVIGTGTGEGAEEVKALSTGCQWANLTDGSTSDAGGSYMTSDIQISHNVSNMPMRINIQAHTFGSHHVFRNSLGRPISQLGPAGYGPVRYTRNALEGTLPSGGNTVSTGAECVAASGVLDINFALEGSYRTNFLGTHGAEVV